MAKFSDIESRLYNLKLGNTIHESIDMDYIYRGINRDNITNIMSNITPNQINTSNLLESCCNKILEYNLDDKEKKVISESLYRLIPYIPGIKKYKDILSEVANKLEKDIIKEKVSTFIECDRIINNQEKLEEYSNFSSIFENYYVTNDIEQIVVEGCDIINLYKMSPELKINVALENMIYNMDKIKQNYNKKELVNLIYEYFCINYNPDICKKIIKETSIEFDNKSIEYIIEGKDEKKNDIDNQFSSLIRSGKADKTSFMSLIRKLYTQPTDNIVNDLPNILKWIRIGLSFGLAAVFLPLGVLVGIVDHLIEVKINRVEVEKTIKAYKKEKDKIENKKYAVKHPSTEKKYDDLVKEYEKAIQKLEEYRDSLYSDKENEDRTMNESVLEDTVLMELTFNIMCNTITEYCKNSDRNKLKSSICEYIAAGRDINDETDLFGAIGNSSLIPRNIISVHDVNRELDRPEIAGSLILNINKFNNDHMDIDDNGEDMDAEGILDEMFYYNNLYSALNENEFTAKAKMLAINAKKKLQSLTDKEKMITKFIDDTYDRMQEKLKQEATNKNREAVIKGSILPSLSSLLKLIMGSYLIGLLVTPVLGIIGFVGGLALAKSATDNERRFILDEIDIQLNVVEKKISLADSRNDMKAYEQLLRIQKKLKQEKQRIIYSKGAANIYHASPKD